MGGQFCKTKGEAPLPMFQRGSSLQYTAETETNSTSSISQSSDSTLQVVTDPVVNTTASRVNLLRTVSIDSLREVIIGSPLVINREDIQSILDSKKPKWINQKLFLLVKDYFDKSLLSSDPAIDEWLRRARESQKLLQLAFQHLDKTEEDVVDDKKYYLATLEALPDLKDAGNPFTKNFTQDFLTVRNNQVLMLEQLEPLKNEYDQKLECVKARKKVSSIIFVSSFAATFTFAVASIAVAAPRIVAAGAVATSIPIGTIGTWFNSLWKGYENALKGQKELIGSMYTSTCVAIMDLEKIHIRVNSLSEEIQTLIEYTDSASRKEEPVKIVLEEIEKKLGVLFERIEDFAKKAERCSQDIRSASKVVLQKVGKHPAN